MTLIGRRDLMPGPVAASRIVTALLSFAEICSRHRYIFAFKCHGVLLETMKCALVCVVAYNTVEAVTVDGQIRKKSLLLNIC